MKLLFRERRTRRLVPSCILDDDGVAELEEVLEMRVRVLTWQTMELVCLHHRDEASAELEVSGPSVDSGPGGHVGNVGNRVVAE